MMNGSAGMGNPAMGGGDILGLGGGGAPPPAGLYNSISQQGMPPTNDLEQSQQPAEQTNPAEDAIQRFGVVFNQFQTLSSMPEYSAATKEAADVMTAMKNWLQAVTANLSQAGTESTANTPV